MNIQTEQKKKTDQDEAPNDTGGEDEGSTAKEGHDDHLKEDQKPL